jgi:hypothetical protein
MGKEKADGERGKWKGEKQYDRKCEEKRVLGREEGKKGRDDGDTQRGLERMGCEESGRGKGRREKVAMIKRDGRAGDGEGRRWEMGFRESKIRQNASGRKGDLIKENGRKGHSGRVRGKVWQKRGKGRKRGHKMGQFG